MPLATITTNKREQIQVDAVAVVGKAIAYDRRQLSGNKKGRPEYSITIEGCPYAIRTVFLKSEAVAQVKFYGGDPKGIALVAQALSDADAGKTWTESQALSDLLEGRSFNEWESSKAARRGMRNRSGRFQVFAILRGKTSDVETDDLQEALALALGLEQQSLHMHRLADFVRVTELAPDGTVLPVLERRTNLHSQRMVTIKRNEKLVPFDPTDLLYPEPPLPLDTIRVLYREPDTLALQGIPYEMRPGQSPKDIKQAANSGKLVGSRGTSDWIWLGTPGWWGDMGPKNRRAVEQFLERYKDFVPQNPYEWDTLPKGNPTVRESESDLTYRLDRMRRALEKYEQEGADAEALLAQIRATRGDPEARKALDDTMNTMAYHPRSPIYWEVITKGHFDLLKTYGWSLANALLMQYSMPKNLRKEIEQGLQYFNKRNLVMPKSKDRSMIARSELAASTFLKHLTQWREFVEVAGEVLLSCQDNAQDASCRVKASSFELINSGGFDEATMSEVARALQAAEDALTSKGLGRVCYGEAHVTNRINQEGVAAEYQPRPDTFLVRAVKKYSEEYVRTCIHELGHRLIAKYDSRAARTARSSLHLRLKDGARDLHSTVPMPNIGDKVTIGKKTFEVTGFGKPLISARTGQVMSYLPGDVISLKLDGDELPRYNVTFAGWAKNHLGRKSKGQFITRYAMRNEEENFCEMLSFYCLNQLPEDQVELLKPVLLSFSQEPTS